MTMRQVFDPVRVLEQIEPVQEAPINMDDELYPAHLIPD